MPRADAAKGSGKSKRARIASMPTCTCGRPFRGPSSTLSVTSLSPAMSRAQHSAELDRHFGACESTLPLCTLYFVLCSVDYAVTLSSTGAKNRFKEMTPATSGVLAGFPPLFPIWNPCELRGLCRRSYFGPKTCGGSITNVIEVGRVLNPGFPFSPLNVHFCVQPQAQRC